MKLVTVALTTVLCTNAVHGNIIRSLWDSIKSKEDLTAKHESLRKVHVTPNFYYYKLTPKREAVAEEPHVIPYDPVAIAEALKYQNSKHPDNKPVSEVIKTSDSFDDIARDNDRQVIYGEDSPLKDVAVTAAWEQANEAQRRLDEHRKYMERVRQSRKSVEQSKTTAASQTVGESK